MKKITSIGMFSNGNMFVCTEDGEQVPELQYNAFNELFRKAKELGYVIDDDVSILTTQNRYKKVKGYNNIEVVE